MGAVPLCSLYMQGSAPISSELSFHCPPFFLYLFFFAPAWSCILAMLPSTPPPAASPGTAARPNEPSEAGFLPSMSPSGAILCVLCPPHHRHVRTITSQLVGPFPNFQPPMILHVHLICGMWAPEVYWERGHDRLINVHAAYARGQKTKCSVCSCIGATIKCHVLSCTKNFQIACLATGGCVTQESRFLATCSLHAKEAEGKQPERLPRPEAGGCRTARYADAEKDDAEVGLDTPHGNITGLRRNATETICAAAWRVASEPPASGSAMRTGEVHCAAFPAAAALAAASVICREAPSRREKAVVADYPVTRIKKPSARASAAAGPKAPSALPSDPDGGTAGEKRGAVLLLRNLRHAPLFAPGHFRKVAPTVPSSFIYTDVVGVLNVPRARPAASSAVAPSSRKGADAVGGPSTGLDSRGVVAGMLRRMASNQGKRERNESDEEDDADNGWEPPTSMRPQRPRLGDARRDSSPMVTRLQRQQALRKSTAGGSLSRFQSTEPIQLDLTPPEDPNKPCAPSALPATEPPKTMGVASGDDTIAFDVSGHGDDVVTEPAAADKPTTVGAEQAAAGAIGSSSAGPPMPNARTRAHLAATAAEKRLGQSVAKAAASIAVRPPRPPATRQPPVSALRLALPTPSAPASAESSRCPTSSSSPIPAAPSCRRRTCKSVLPPRQQPTMAARYSAIRGGGDSAAQGLLNVGGGEGADGAEGNVAAAIDGEAADACVDDDAGAGLKKGVKAGEKAGGKNVTIEEPVGGTGNLGSPTNHGEPGDRRTDDDAAAKVDTSLKGGQMVGATSAGGARATKHEPDKDVADNDALNDEDEEILAEGNAAPYIPLMQSNAEGDGVPDANHAPQGNRQNKKGTDAASAVNDEVEVIVIDSD